MSAIRGVGYVTIFRDASPARLIAVIEPDVHCKGTDYTPENVPEAAIVRAYGGRTVVDPTNVGIGRDGAALQRISRRTGLNIVMGAGFYLEPSHPDYVQRMSIDEIAQAIVTDCGGSAEKPEVTAELFPLIRGLASTDRPQVGHFTDAPVVLGFLARSKHPALAALGTSCPDHFLRTKVAPLVLDLPPSAPLAEVTTRLGKLHADYRTGYRAYYEHHADAS